ncbi:hypothetical protein AAVH_40459, partial [Aphelenchoides avenae]
MAKRQNYELTFTETAVDLAVDGSEMLSVVLDEAYVEAVYEVASVVGLHAVTKVSIDHGDWLRLPTAWMFAMVPALEYASSLRLRYVPPDGTPTSADYVDAFVRGFSQVQDLELALYRPFDWTYLRRESALKLRTLKFLVVCESQSSEEEVLRYCAALSQLPVNEPMRFLLLALGCADRFRQQEVERVVE